MPIQASSALPTTIAALAVSLSLSTLTLLTLPAIGTAARAAETCLAAPKGAAPQGSHWRYRVEQGSQRKCWRLVQKDQKGRSTQADAQGDVDEEAEADVAPPAATRSGGKKPGRVAEPAPKAAPDLASNYTSETAADAPPVPWPDPPAEMMQRLDAPNAPATVAQAQNDAPAPAPIAEPPVQQPMVAAEVAAPAPATAALQFVFVVVAFLGLLGCAIFYLASIRLRRSDVLNRAQHLNALPTEIQVSPDAPTFAPLPPMNLMSRHDDVEEAMQRFAERRKRQAA
jgi:hypothetical protein